MNVSCQIAPTSLLVAMIQITIQLEIRRILILLISGIAEMNILIELAVQLNISHVLLELAS